VILYCRSLRTIYIIHSPSQQPTAQELEQELREMLRERGREDIDIHRLNTGNDWDAERAEEVLSSTDCIDYTEFLKELEL